jgi:uncharacterized protein YndB with AHSA1/START domain
MPSQYRVTRQIAAPPDRVWALLVDADGYDTWNRAVVSIKGPIAEGNRVELVSIANPKRTFKPKVVEMAAPRRMVWADGMPLGMFRGERVYELAPTSVGTTFTMTETFSGPLSGLISKSIPDMTESFDLFADGLKAAAEAS